MSGDGTYTYKYDANGNRTEKFIDVNENGDLDDGDSTITLYDWDYRNRLVEVNDYVTHGDIAAEDPSQTVEFVYDAFNNRISKIVDADGAGSGAAVRTNFALLDGEVYLEFNGTTLSHRYMPGPSIDMNLAIEEMNADGTSQEVLWALLDHQGTVRDVIDDSGAVVNSTANTLGLLQVSKDRIMRFYVIEPEVAGELGPETEIDTSAHPPIVGRFQHVFSGWLGDEILECFPCYLVVSQLGKAFVKHELSGCELAPVEISRSEQFEEFYSGTELPAFERLVIKGHAGQDDFGLGSDHRLVISERAMSLLRTAVIENCDIEEYE